MMEIAGYTIVARLHIGHRFSIYRGYHNNDKQKVIFKICRAEQPSLTELATLQHEYELLKPLELPHIIRAHQLVKLQHQLALVLEDMDGQSLEQYLSDRPLTLDDFFTIALQLVDALGEIHLQHIIHKDINPGNILIHPQTMTVKLTDFSISTQLTQQDNNNILLKNLEGTLPYLSPEQSGRMNRALDYRTDFYSLGVTFFKMLTAELPFTSQDPLTLVHCHLAEIPPAVNRINPEIPTPIAALIAKLLAKSPEDRYASAAGLKADLLKCQQEWKKFQYIEPFPLGQDDIQDHLVLSQKLYGRENQITQLLSVVKNLNQQKHHAELMLVSGYSGIGKTSLVREIYKPLTQQQGYFVSGKYDQLQRTTPYAAFIEAFQELIRRLLAEPENRLFRIRQQLQTTLQDNSHFLLQLIPNASMLLDVKPTPPATSFSADIQKYFMQTLQDFIAVIAQAEHPLVIFLDDLQWIDNASLQLIHFLFHENKLQHFLLIGAYRNNEVSSDQPLMVTLNQLRKNQVPITDLVLRPLTENNIYHLLSDCLNTDNKQLLELARLLSAKTEGNPFFINEFLKKLYQEKLLTFSYERRQWQWNMEQIKQQAIMDNVIDLLTHRINELPESTQYILQLAACIGHTFGLQTLATISEKDPVEIAKCLWQATCTNFIVPLNESSHLLKNITSEILKELPYDIKYRFVHDRIQQTAYQLIPRSKQQQVHLQIGRLLLQEKPLTENDARLFEIVNHLNHNCATINNSKEKFALAEYNLWAGKKAKAAMAYEEAKNYIQTGLILVNNNHENETLHNLWFNLSKELAACEYLTSNYDAAKKIFNELLEQTSDISSKITIYQSMCEISDALNEHQRVVEFGLAALKLAKINIPTKPSPLHLLGAIIKVKYLLGGKKKIQNLMLEPMTDPTYIATSALINQMVNSAYYISPNLFVLLSLINMQLSLRYGYTENTLYALICYAFSIRHVFHQHEESLALVDFYHRLIQRYGNTQLEGRNCFGLGWGLYVWQYPLEKSRDILFRGYQLAYEAGNLTHSCYCGLSHIALDVVTGKDLQNCSESFQALNHFINKMQITLCRRPAFIMAYLVDCLISKETLSLEKITQQEHAFLNEEEKAPLASFYSFSAKMLYLLGYYDQAYTFGKKHEQYAKYHLGFYDHMESYFYYALSITTLHHMDKTIDLRPLKKIRKKLQLWASWCPENYQPYLLLLEAEMARIADNKSLAVDLYEQCIFQAKVQNILCLVGIANECAARFYLGIKRLVPAKGYMQNAYYIYQQWGAKAKCNLLEQQHSEWFQPQETITAATITKTTTLETNNFSIDTLSILKMTQTISGEIQLEKLLQKLLVILLENAGAQRGVFVFKEGDSWFVQAEGTISSQQITLTRTERLEKRTDLPLNLIQYVLRTKEFVLLQKPQDFMSYNEDSYLKEVNPQSVLVLPILHQGQLQGLLYIENRVTPNAFTAEHVKILQVLSSQAAISLENAQLYYQATHDPLTGLANRSLLYQSFKLGVKKNANNNTLIAILFLDLDGFKKINDTLGHEIGDKLLLHIASLLKQNLNENDLAVRLGGDEFIVMLEDVTDLAQIEMTAEYILAQFKKPIVIQDHSIDIGTSIGISIYPQNGIHISELLKRADLALYNVKKEGKGFYKFYNGLQDHTLNKE